MNEHFTKTRKSGWKTELLALAFALGFVKINREREILDHSFIYKTFRSFRLPKFIRYSSSAVLTLVLIVTIVPLFQAFEAHVINVTAEPVLIEPPMITLGIQDPLTAFIMETDSDATHIFFTFVAGIDPAAVSDPVCGGEGGPIGLAYTVNVVEDTVVKAIACDGNTLTDHHSIVTTRVFAHVQAQVLEESILNTENSSGNVDEAATDDQQPKQNNSEQNQTTFTPPSGISGDSAEQ